jgi:hypothetical protein
MTQYIEQRNSIMRSFVETCERKNGMSSEEFIRYYRELESHGSEEEYNWWVYLHFLGAR